MKNKISSNLKLFSTNGAGVVGGKVSSLRSAVKEVKANLVTVQETHSKRKGKIQIEDFVIFEAIRKAKGGGTMIASHKDFNPKLIVEYEDEFELLVVEIKVDGKEIRVISGYGPQENWPEEKRMPFFLAIETEIEKAILAGKSILIEMDANAKLGKSIIAGDPHEQSPNGTILANIVERHNLIVGNGRDTCQGTITRQRTTKTRSEKSVIDLIMFSSDMLQHLVNIQIDEARKYVLTKVVKKKNGIKIQESDHNPIVAEFSLKIIQTEEDNKLEMYNLKNEECQKKFKEYTTNTKMLSSVFDTKEEDINIMTNRFLKKLNGCIALNFKKIRFKHKEDKLEKLHERLRSVKNKTDTNSIEEQEDVLNEIVNQSKSNFQKLKEEVEKSKSKEGGMNAKAIWKLKKILCPRSKDPPTAILDSYGNLLTENKAIENRALEVYSKILEGNEMREDLKDLEDTTNELCHARLNLTKSNVTKPWDMEELKDVLKKLVKNKSRDADGYANELFMLSVAGDDLLLAVLKLCNKIKQKQTFPKALEKCNITSLHKKKSRNDLDNYRGVFRVSVLRSILDRLMYNSTYEVIDQNLTDGNVGARKGRSCRDNIFVLGAVTNSVLNGTSKPIQIQTIDVQKCFDKLWLEACINSLYEAGLKSDILNLLYIENKNADIAVKVNGNLSRRTSVKNVVMQGSVWGGLKCTSQMDKMNKIMNTKETLLYKYKGDPQISIGVLGMIDDTLGISECGAKAVEKNAIMNSFIETHRLTMHEDKSTVIHVGSVAKCLQPCPKLSIHDKHMQEAQSAKYLGNYITTKGGTHTTIEERRKTGWGRVAQILGIIGEVDMGQHRMEVGLILRKAMLTNNLLFCAEAWSDISDKDIKRLEQVDTALLKSLVNGHSKTPVIFHHLETGTLKLRHILMQNRLLYHQHILTRDDSETIKKIYNKQKEDSTKGDWYEIIKKDFQFLGRDIDEDYIKNSSKIEYKKEVKKLIKKAAFEEYMQEKITKSKLNLLKYEQLDIQPYLQEPRLSMKEINLLYSLRSRSHPAKTNYRKMYNNNFGCFFGCLEDEDQKHIFEKCEKIRNNLTIKETVDISHIYGNPKQQTEAAKILIQIEDMRYSMVQKLHHEDDLPGGNIARTRAV